MRLGVDGLVVRQGGFTLGPVAQAWGPGIWRVCGPNGSGKSTLLRAVAGDLSPLSGSAWVEPDGPTGRLDIHRIDRARRLIGFCPSAPELPDFLSVSEGVAMLGALRGGGQAAGAAGRRIPEIGLQPSTRLGTCSAGMRHKAELLAALAGEPPVLLLDEPFANLDVEAIGVLCGWLDGWRRDRVILISHHGEAPLRVDGEWRVGSGGAAGRDAG